MLEPNAHSRFVYLPKGIWYHLFTDEKYDGGKELSILTPIDHIPVFVAGGAVLPYFPFSNTSEKNHGLTDNGLLFWK
ncbi:MAG: hypothetical protein IPK25_08810 [Saprospiraceae bacterium]|nr:hypothetical protein [Saprospiraceae bacterium]